MSRELVGRPRLRPRGEALVGSLRSLCGLRSRSVDATHLVAMRCRPKESSATLISLPQS